MSERDRSSSIFSREQREALDRAWLGEPPSEWGDIVGRAESAISTLRALGSEVRRTWDRQRDREIAAAREHADRLEETNRRLRFMLDRALRVLRRDFARDGVGHLNRWAELAERCRKDEIEPRDRRIAELEDRVRELEIELATAAVAPAGSKGGQS